MKDEKALVILSGGQDSTTCLYWALKEYKEVEAITFDYGQMHRNEIVSASKICSMVKVPHEIVFIEGTLIGGTLLDKPVEGRGENIAPSWVPLRNALFLTIASNRAIVKGVKTLVIGVNSRDYSGYPDCRISFISAFEDMVFYGAEYPLLIEKPLINMTKKDIVLLAKGLLGCWEALAYTLTCYKGEYPPCGECAACKIRAKGFKEAGFPDPLIERSKNE